MKVFIASENVRHGILLSNVLNNFGVSTFQNDSGYQSIDAMISDISSLAESYDILFAITRKPIELGISANKNENIRAAVCKSADDIIEARKSGVNLIVLDSSMVTKDSMANIASEWLSNEGIKSSVMKTISSFIAKEGKESKQVQVPSQVSKQKKRTNDAEDEGKEEKERDYENKEENPRNGSGLVGRIKSALGFE
ncbi:MAG: RpiB/LacA/LacB family sugar-phosphate isomerase [Candidatus Micrarchaeia archaeon]